MFLGQGVLVTPNINVLPDTSFLQPVLRALEFSVLTLGGEVLVARSHPGPPMSSQHDSF